MKKRSTVKFENFLLISTATTGASIGSLVYSWVILPARSVIDTCNESNGLSEVIGNFPEVYNKNVIKLSMTPFIAYAIARGIADQRLHEFDKKHK